MQACPPAYLGHHCRRQVSIHALRSTAAVAPQLGGKFRATPARSTQFTAGLLCLKLLQSHIATRLYTRHSHTGIHTQHCMHPACVTAYFWHTRTVCSTHCSTAPPYVQHTHAHSGLDQPADHHRQTLNSNCHEVNLCFLSIPRGLCCCHTPLTHKLAHSTPHWRRSSKGAEHSAACPAACIVTLPAQPSCILQAPIISCLLPVGL